MHYLIEAPLPIGRRQITLPASKSISNRVLLLNALAPQPARIGNLAECDDTVAMQRALRSGDETIDVGAAGTAMRFLTAYYAIQAGTTRILTGTERMQQRPIALLTEALRTIGASIRYIGQAGFPPLRIEGRPLQGGTVGIDGSVSSQYASALLMIAPMMERGITLQLIGRIVSKPYLQQTVRLMRRFGIRVDEEENRFTVHPGQYRPVPIDIEPDWSAASYWYSIAALRPNTTLELPGLSPDSLQGDAAIATLFRRLGVSTRFTATGATITNDGRQPIATHFEHDFTDTPDVAQTLAVACALLDIPFRLTGLQSLRIKETDRLTAMQTELRKLGFVVAIDHHSTLEWQGERCSPHPRPIVSTYDDHRMAMAFAPAALRRDTGIRIDDLDVAAKSYPRFRADLDAAGFICKQLIS